MYRKDFKKLFIWCGIGIAAVMLYNETVHLWSQGALFVMTPLSLLLSIIPLWIIIFTVSEGLLSSLGYPFRQKTLWLSLALAAAYYFINTITAFAMNNALVQTGSIAENIIFAALTQCISAAAFCLMLWLCGAGSYGKKCIAVKWNSWLGYCIVIIAAYIITGVLYYIFLWLQLLNDNSFFSMMAMYTYGENHTRINYLLYTGMLMFMAISIHRTMKADSDKETAE